ISQSARTGSYSTAVGSQLTILFIFEHFLNSGQGSGTLNSDFDPDLSFTATDPTTGAPIAGISIVLPDGTVIPTNSSGSTYSCAGFQAPFDVALSLKTRTNRAIPLKAQLFDSSGNPVTPATLAGARPPVVNVSYASGTSAAVDETSLLEPLGAS